MNTVTQELTMIDFKNIAEEVVGKVGESTTNGYSVMGEEYVQFTTPLNDLNEAYNQWIKWIKAYMEFAKNKYINNISDLGQPSMLYWRTLPAISKIKGKTSTIYARLLVSSCSENVIKLAVPPLCPACLRELGN